MSSNCGGIGKVILGEVLVYCFVIFVVLTSSLGCFILMVVERLGPFRLPIANMGENALDSGIPTGVLRLILTGFPEVMRSCDPLHNRSLWPDGLFICSSQSLCSIPEDRV